MPACSSSSGQRSQQAPEATETLPVRLHGETDSMSPKELGPLCTTKQRVQRGQKRPGMGISHLPGALGALRATGSLPPWTAPHWAYCSSEVRGLVLPPHEGPSLPHCLSEASPVATGRGPGTWSPPVLLPQTLTLCPLPTEGAAVTLARSPLSSHSAHPYLESGSLAPGCRLQPGLGAQCVVGITC